jgi:hypothetical protein
MPHVKDDYSCPSQMFVVIFKGQKRRKRSEIKHSAQIYEFQKISTAKFYKIYPCHLTWARVIIFNMGHLKKSWP